MKKKNDKINDNVVAENTNNEIIQENNKDNCVKIAIELLKKFEGYRSKAYKCVAGVWTIGYGTIDKVKEGDTITKQEALELLKSRVESDYEKIKKLIKVKLKDNQIGVLLSFVYNVGIEAFAQKKKGGSTLLKRINANETIEKIEAAYMEWVVADKKQPDGSVKKEKYASIERRRKEEFEIYKK